MELNKFNYMLEIDILRNSLQKNLSVLRDECPKDAKTPCWLRLCWYFVAGYEHFSE